MHDLPSPTLRSGSSFRGVLETDRRGTQLSTWIAVCLGLKPAGDLWIPRHRWSAFVDAARQVGVIFRLDCYFDRHSPHLSINRAVGTFNTTRAVLSEHAQATDEAHVFIALNQESLDNACASGWYPLMVRQKPVPKPLVDHTWFGESLGYPPCCISFFAKRNNWHSDNTYFAGFNNSEGIFNWKCNSLLRHSAFTLCHHASCSFNCQSSSEYAVRLYNAILAEEPAYAEQIRAWLTSPMLCLSELKIVAFEGQITSPGVLEYERVFRVNPTSRDDVLGIALQTGDRLELDGNIIRIYHGPQCVRSFYTRADQYGPELPFVVQCTG